MARKLAPRDVDIWATAATLLDGRATSQALIEFAAIIKAHPKHAYSRAQRARILLGMQRPADALPDLNVALSGEAPALEYLTLRAKVHQMLDCTSAALADYDRAIALEPHNLSAIMERAELQVKVGDYSAALQGYEKVLGPVGQFAGGGEQVGAMLLNRARALVGLRRYDDAVNDAFVAISSGGKQSVLRTQIVLRHSGFPEVPLTGQVSDAMRTALRSCFGLAACFQGVMRSI